MRANPVWRLAGPEIRQMPPAIQLLDKSLNFAYLRRGRSFVQPLPQRFHGGRGSDGDHQHLAVAHVGCSAPKPEAVGHAGRAGAEEHALYPPGNDESATDFLGHDAHSTRLSPGAGGLE